jgi:hypothetical protein
VDGQQHDGAVPGGGDGDGRRGAAAAGWRCGGGAGWLLLEESGFVRGGEMPRSVIPTSFLAKFRITDQGLESPL